MAPQPDILAKAPMDNWTDPHHRGVDGRCAVLQLPTSELTRFRGQVCNLTTDLCRLSLFDKQFPGQPNKPLYAKDRPRRSGIYRRCRDELREGAASHTTWGSDSAPFWGLLMTVHTETKSGSFHLFQKLSLAHLRFYKPVSTFLIPYIEGVSKSDVFRVSSDVFRVHLTFFGCYQQLTLISSSRYQKYPKVVRND